MSLTLKISCVTNPPLPGQRLYAEAIAYSQPQPSYAKRHHQRHVYLRILSFINQCFAFPSGKVTPRWSSSDISLTLTPRKGSRGKCRRPRHRRRFKPAPTKSRWMHCRERFGSGNSGQELYLLNHRHPGVYQQHTSYAYHHTPSPAKAARGYGGYKAAMLLRGSIFYGVFVSPSVPGQGRHLVTTEPPHPQGSPGFLGAGRTPTASKITSLATAGSITLGLSAKNHKSSHPNPNFQAGSSFDFSSPCPGPALLSTSIPGERADPRQDMLLSRKHPPESCWSLSRTGEPSSCPPARSRGCWRARFKLTLHGTHYKRQISSSRRRTSSSQCIPPAPVVGKWGELEPQGEASRLPRTRVHEGTGGLWGARAARPQANHCVEEERGQRCLLPAAAC